MNKFYYGAWQNFYHLSWPIRFLIEGILFLFFLFLFYKFIKLIGRVLRVKPYLIKGCVWIATEVVYLFGKNSPWAIETDNKVIEWGDKKLNGSEEEKTVKKLAALKCCVVLGVIILYVMAVFVDLPLSEHIQEEYLIEFASVKDFFRQYEEAISRGYEAYPPLFVKTEPEVIEIEEELPEAVEEKEKILIYIQLNEKGSNGANIRREPSLNGKIVGGVNGKSEILYQYQWECDDEGRYWVKVYIPSVEVEGWLSGKLVDSVQLEMLINEP